MGCRCRDGGLRAPQSGRWLRPARRVVAAGAAALLSAALWPGLGRARAVGEVQSIQALGARVDWATGEVRVTASVQAPKKGKPDALKASALALARANLKKLLAQVRGGGDTYAIPDAPAAMAAFLKGARTLSAGPVSGGRFQVVLAVTLPRAADGSETPAAALAPAGKRGYQEPDPAQVRAFPPPAPTGEESLLTPADAKGPFTGLVVDARGFELRTAMSPRLLDAALRDVYTGAHASADFVEDVGVVGYMGSIAAALRSARVGSRPLVVRALGAGDVHKMCPVISLDDARRFLSDAGASGVAGKCAVCFIINSLRLRDQ